jgi:predicted ribosome quality control (RQC) complex YloA/Tae2 family protein
MSLRPGEATLLAKELERELKGAVVQQVACPTPTRAYLELRVPGRTETLLACADAKASRLSTVERRPANPKVPPAWQSVLRRELVGLALLDVESVEPSRLLLAHFGGDREGQPIRRAVVLEYGDSPGVALVTREGRVMALSRPFREGVRPGSTWTPPEPQPVRPQESRLSGDHVHLRLAHAAEALFGGQEQKRWLDERLAPVRAKLKRLARTRDKVKAEVDRTDESERLKWEGELLAQNLYRLKRGLTEVSVPEYRADGTVVEHLVRLDPARTPQQEVERRFHQYRRLTRGMAFAKTRLEQLDREQARLEAELVSLEQAPVEAPAAAPRKVASGDAALPPYRTYDGHGGQPIWVGRGAAHNDALTFHEARPWHIWFHARGVPGAHVVVPLGKNVELSQEVMLDAAHLALHHSDLKGEPRGEVSSVPIKRVRKGRDADPGAVTYTGEKTVMLRVEPDRLQRLLATERLG